MVFSTFQKEELRNEEINSCASGAFHFIPDRQLLVLPYLPDTVPTHWNAAGRSTDTGANTPIFFWPPCPF